MLAVGGCIQLFLFTANTLEDVLTGLGTGGGGGNKFVIMAERRCFGLFLKNGAANLALASFRQTRVGAISGNGGNLFGRAVFGFDLFADGALDGVLAVFAGFGFVEFMLFGFGFGCVAVFADVGVCVIAVINAMRALKAPK